jgi:outer membrane protein OmpA-like peptidoglycan-associated protein
MSTLEFLNGLTLLQVLCLIIGSLLLNGCPGGNDSDLSGEWEVVVGSNIHLARLDRNGKGSYTWQGGQVTTTSIKDRRWHGTWRQADNDREGEFELVLSEDGTQAKGDWWYTRVGTKNNIPPRQEGGSWVWKRLTPAPVTKEVEEGRVQEAAQPSSPVPRPQVPLREGLTIVATYQVQYRPGDFESITTVTNVDAKAVTVTLSTDQPIRCAGRLFRRALLREDLERAHGFWMAFDTCAAEPKPQLTPGSTAISVSANVLRDLKAEGRTNFSAMLSSAAGQVMVPGVLTRVERGSVPFKAIVNDDQVEVAVVHARWHPGQPCCDHEFWILDDVNNPLLLRQSTNGKAYHDVVKLSFPTGETVARLERDLAKDGRTVVYGIYFEFASDGIKEESNAVLADIAKMLRQNPGWSLAVEGHTDNLGGDAYNLDLAKRRATAVKEALVAGYKIDGKRLHPAGFGASKPKDTNDTVEGRARNRRVELVRVP